jgi:23S rRNA (adenine1618-N6)-methyltransferase
MLIDKREHPIEKTALHPRNKHRERYNFEQLTSCCPELAPFVMSNKYNDLSIDFSNPVAVKMLNKALLVYFYGIGNWDIPQNYLCPPIPGRADYIHYLSDLLATGHRGQLPREKPPRVLDIGMGANCIYPIIGTVEYGWSFTASDIDPQAIASAQKIIDGNPALVGKVELRLQPDPSAIFKGIIQPNEQFEATLCNPPFHASLAEAQAGTRRKLNNLGQKPTKNPTLNFGGQNNELWCNGGERQFLLNMIEQSMDFAQQVTWFTSLVSKEDNLRPISFALKKVKAVQSTIIDMGQGNKKSRIVAWTFL